MDELLDRWKIRLSSFRAEAELSFMSRRDTQSLETIEECFEQEQCRHRQHHYETCVRQWENAIEELEEALND